MSLTVWKFPLQPGETVLEIPVGGKPLSVANLREGIHATVEPRVWFLVDDALPRKPRKVRAYGTGFVIPQDTATSFDFAGTFQLESEWRVLVFHVFVERESAS